MKIEIPAFKKVIVIIIIFFTVHASAQQWMQEPYLKTKAKTGDNYQYSFYDIQNAFRKYEKEFDNREKEEEKEKIEKEGENEGKFEGYMQFKRWEAFMEPRVYPHGDITVVGSNWENYQEFLDNSTSTTKIINNNQTFSTTWTAMGPFGPLAGVATNGLPRKAGRINFITFHPTNPNIFWVGAAGGGLWKTTTGGATWTTNTDNLSVIGCTDLAIDPTNPQIMYLATGDGYLSARNPSSIGVLKSTDGGVTWSATGLVFALSQKVEMRHILINPTNPLIVMATASNGIHRSIDGGLTWAAVIATNTYDIEFNPLHPDTVYASGLRFRRSIDAGATWTTIAGGSPTSGSCRMELATTVANPRLVYLISVSSSTLGLQGVYRSTDAGTTFSLMASTPDIVGADCFTTGLQGWYDLAFDASPLNQNEIVAGGLGAWQSLDGGATWSVIGCGYTWSSPPPFLHTDNQEFEYTTSGTLYGVNDGGVYQYTGTQWNDLSSPMNIAQVYKIGLSSLSPNLWISGHQDDGSNIYKNGVYSASLAADGMDCFIDRTNDQNLFAEMGSGSVYKSTNGGTSWNACATGLVNPGTFISPWKQDPQVATTLYAGRKQMFKSINSAASWVATAGTMTGVVSTEYITEFAIAPSNNQTIYAIHGTTGMFVTTNGGATWTLSNTGITTTSGALTFVSVDPTNSQIAYVTQSGYASGKKVYQTVNGGASWTNISYNLPNLPANCSVIEPSAGRLYVGMDVGVYYYDNINLNWVLYNTGLPNTPVVDMEISPAAPTKLRAATFGRGVYEVDVLSSTGILANTAGDIKFNVFPNPTNDKLTINMNVEQSTDIVMEVSDMSGKIVLKQIQYFSHDKKDFQLDISALANEVYFLKLSSADGNSQTIKIIKQ